jgi:ubiquinone/menaquinone biosynthesis C-methylase UbiE
MAAPFDHIAPTYNSVFSRSVIGQLQRKRVWRYVETIIPQLKGFEMLELNCGSGEDAMLFGDRGFNIVATDINEEMLKVTQKKAEQVSMQHRISSHYLDLDSISDTLFDKKYDLVFSNFGGLNSISPESFRKLLENLPAILKPGGRFIGVVMPKFCAWETVFFLLRFQFKKAFRRFSAAEGPADAQGGNPRIWYYHPSEVRSWARDRFKLVSVKPVGIALPPAYIERFVSLRKHWLFLLNRFEKRMANTAMLSGMADNFIIDLQLR